MQLCSHFGYKLDHFVGGKEFHLLHGTLLTKFKLKNIRVIKGWYYKDKDKVMPNPDDERVYFIAITDSSNHEIVYFEESKKKQDNFLERFDTFYGDDSLKAFVLEEKRHNPKKKEK